jgi:hypothetical protein
MPELTRRRYPKRRSRPYSPRSHPPPGRDRAQGEEVKPAPRQKGRIWTAEDDDRLKSLIEANLSIDLIAAKMKRTIQGVKYRASTLGISTKRVWVGLRAKR